MEFLGDNSETDKKKMKKRFHRHTPHQIHRLESSFNECQHPDEKQRLQLSKELGLAPRQIKFWFQNRRTQKKAQHERADNCALKEENDRIRFENIAIREAIKRAICLSCGDAPLHEDSYFDEQKLRIENAHLREELERVSSIAAKFMGRPPLAHLPPLLNTMPSELFHSGPSLDFDLLPGSSTSSLTVPTLPSQPNLGLSDMDKSLMTNIAVTAMEEFLRLTQTDEPLWIRTSGCRDVLNLQSYENMFPRSSSRRGGGKNHNLRKEATRSSGVVSTNAMTLVDMLMDSVKSSELFSSVVASSKTLAVVSSGMRGSHGDALHLMLEELQVLSPLVPTREFSVLRYYQQIEHGTWAIVNVSYELPQFISHSRSYRFPSGCLIQDLSNGYSKVTWVEHVEVEEQEPVHEMFKDNIREGIAFGAERWIATLQRMCERFTALVEPATSSRDLKGVIPSPEGKGSIMRLAQRMVSNFCLSVGTSNNTRSTVVSGLDAFGIRVTSYKSQNEPNGMVLCAATSFWLPVSPQRVFNFLKDERTRPQWDVLLDGNSVQEVAHIANGSHPGNCISVLRGFNASSSQNNMLILQESCIDSSGSLVVYTPVDLSALKMAMTGQDTSYIPILPSGFAVLPEGGRNNQTAEIKAEGGGGGGGSLITVGFQIMVSSLQSGKLNMESMETVNNLISTTVHQIKTTLNSPSTA
ncbi:Homeobox-leucine zipper protein HDG12 [Raphanus sativus]|uniref:Homeobox-leucine zipper protein HDG12 n=1 Tax=Raphanus sativus TaxID=3726 RepID=A0A6J0JAP6_RAPSA|nr:homeobox-leucine zipper protein HDG12 [Raphanus sativus]KAJ4916069.1 Homeobox-leucine zipper protein HDG12 [Raphanus sativus]